METNNIDINNEHRVESAEPYRDDDGYTYKPEGVPMDYRDRNHFEEHTHYSYGKDVFYGWNDCEIEDEMDSEATTESFYDELLRRYGKTKTVDGKTVEVLDDQWEKLVDEFADACYYGCVDVDEMKDICKRAGFSLDDLWDFPAIFEDSKEYYPNFDFRLDDDADYTMGADGTPYVIDTYDKVK